MTTAKLNLSRQDAHCPHGIAVGMEEINLFQVKAEVIHLGSQRTEDLCRSLCCSWCLYMGRSRLVAAFLGRTSELVRVAARACVYRNIKDAGSSTSVKYEVLEQQLCSTQLSGRAAGNLQAPLLCQVTTPPLEAFLQIPYLSDDRAKRSTPKTCSNLDSR